MDIISMAQQARPKPKGQMELLRAQFTALSSCVKMMPSSWSRLPKSSGLVNVRCFPREVLIFSSTLFSHTNSAETNAPLKETARVLARRSSGAQIVFGERNGAHGAEVLEDGAGPERGVLAGASVLIPTAAATRLPDGASHVVAQIRRKMFLRFGANFHRGNGSVAHQLQAVDDVSHLRFDHQHHGIVAEARVGSEKHKEIRKAADRDAEIRAQAIAPRIVNLEAVSANQ